MQLFSHQIPNSKLSLLGFNRGATENKGRENGGPSKYQGVQMIDMKIQDMKLQDMKMPD